MRKTPTKGLSRADRLMFLLCVGAFPFLNGCRTHAFYHSPYNSLADTYHPMPLMSESVKSATYASGYLSGGSANENSRDDVRALGLDVYRMHQFGMFQAYYGGNLTLGSYRVGSYDSAGFRYASIGLNEPLINSRAGNKSFGGFGLDGGINAAIPLGRGEIRFPEVFFSYRHESGQYLQFRKSLPDTAANSIFKGRATAIIGIGLELAAHLPHGMLGYRVALGGGIYNPRSQYKGNWQNDGRSLGFFSTTLSYTYKSVSIFGQLSVGQLTTNAQLGLNYRIGARHGKKDRERNWDRRSYQQQTYWPF